MCVFSHKAGSARGGGKGTIIIPFLDSFHIRIAKTEHIDPNLTCALESFCVFFLIRLVVHGEEAKEQ